jgi:hypothetical protein
MTYYGAEKVGTYSIWNAATHLRRSLISNNSFIRLGISRGKGARSFGADIITVLEQRTKLDTFTPSTGLT